MYNQGPIVFSTYTSNVLATDSIPHAVPLVSTTSKVHKQLLLPNQTVMYIILPIHAMLAMEVEL